MRRPLRLAPAGCRGRGGGISRHCKLLSSHSEYGMTWHYKTRPVPIMSVCEMRPRMRNLAGFSFFDGFGVLASMLQGACRLSCLVGQFGEALCPHRQISPICPAFPLQTRKLGGNSAGQKLHSNCIQGHRIRFIGLKFNNFFPVRYQSARYVV
jgi:hypothetical protein